MVYKDRKTSSIEKRAKKTQGKTFLVGDVDSNILQTIDYLYPDNKIKVKLQTQELTSLCPFSGLPDFAVLTVEYTPSDKIIELKSLKYYLYAFRNVKIYNEHLVNKIMQDLTKTLNPINLRVEAEFTNRGGITNKVSAFYQAK